MNINDLTHDQELLFYGHYMDLYGEPENYEDFLNWFVGDTLAGYKNRLERLEEEIFCVLKEPKWDFTPEINEAIHNVKRRRHDRSNLHHN